MILVDPRAGSCELLLPLANAGLPVEEATLDFGDIAFIGRGVGGADVWIGLEHKKLPDLVQSLNSDRLAGHQLVGMVEQYDRPYLLIEGDWDHDQAGRVTLFGGLKGRRAPVKGAPLAVELEKRVLTLETRGGLRVRWTPNQKATVRYLTALYRFWTDKALDEHKSHLAIHAPDMDKALKIPVSNFRKALNRLCADTGLGLVMTKAIEQRVFDERKGEGSWRKLMLLTEQEVADVEFVTDKGNLRRLGPARARKIMEALK